MTITETAKARKEREREEAIADLRKSLPVGTTVYTSLTHVSSSGQSRGVKVILAGKDGATDISWQVARACEMSLHPKGGVKVGGSGMDMGFHVVYTLSRTLYPKGHKCNGNGSISRAKRCPSNDHSNDYGMLARQYDNNHDADYSQRMHNKSEYVSARSEWMRAQMDDPANKSVGYKRGRVHSDGGYALHQSWL